jgi:hypothetical protein
MKGIGNLKKRMMENGCYLKTFQEKNYFWSSFLTNKCRKISILQKINGSF